MEATEILMSEHRVIERVISAMESAATFLEQGGEVRPGFFVEAADFIKGFADGCHHKKEEGVLFPAMTENGAPVNDGPVGVMLFEHEQGRMFTRVMREAALKLADDPSARGTVVKNALGYAALLRQHIMKEDRILFPMADHLLPLEEQVRVADGFEHIEHEETGAGIHERYLILAESLENEAASFLTEV